MRQREDLLCWMAFVLIFQSSPRMAIRLIEKFGTPSDIFKKVRKGLSPANEAESLLFEKIRNFDCWIECEKKLDICDSLRVQIIDYFDADYPALLRMINSPPVVLFVRGTLEGINDLPCVAIVGSRKASREGMERAFSIGSDLARQGVIVVSGMAYGIDAMAHKGALHAKGKTIAVWGAGPDRIYPSANRQLADEIIEKGAAISEFPPGTLPNAYNFPRRNRIISAFSLGVVVIEAAGKSGSLITADYALEQGKEVFVLHQGGSINSEGLGRLIDDGAVLIEKASDITECIFSPERNLYKVKKTGHYKRDSVRESRCEKKIQETIHDVISVDKDDWLLKVINESCEISLDNLIAKCGKSSAQVLERLTCMTVEGLVEELPGKKFRIVRR